MRWILTWVVAVLLVGPVAGCGGGGGADEGMPKDTTANPGGPDMNTMKDAAKKK